MSQEKFWCLIAGDHKAFGVSSTLQFDDVEELAKAIRHEKRYLHEHDTSDIVLLKLKEPIPVDPVESLVQRLPKLNTDSFVRLRHTESVSAAFPNRPEAHLQVIVTLPNKNKRRLPDSPFDIDGDRKKRQKGLPRLSDPTIGVRGFLNEDTEGQLQSMKELYERIYLLSEEPTRYSDPNEVFGLPFPSVNQVPPRFSLLDDKISYMGRECFSQIWETFGVVKGDPDHHQAIYLFGGKGVGKSHILAALACLLVRKGTQVVYLPDCRAWLLNPLKYLRNALVFAFVNSEPSFCEELLDCEDLESLARLCAYTSPLCFVVDQVNALDPEGEDVISDSKKDALRMLLYRMCARHILITSTSANHKNFQYMKRETGEKKISLMEGMTSAEMACWWKYHDFSAFSDEEKQRVEDLTGCIPLLLKPFIMHRDKTLESLEPQIWMDEVLEAVGRETINFASAQKSKLNDRYHDQYVPLMHNCLTGGFISGSGLLLDQHYFYCDTDSRARYSCGLARQAFTEFLREHGEDSFFLGNKWHQALEHFKNPSVIGFTVEQILISKMTSAGVRGSIVLPGAKIIPFEGETTRLSVDEPLAYYMPLNFIKKAIDVLFVSVNRQARTAQLVGIRIAVAKQHKDSEAAFLAELNKWRVGLEGFALNVSFLWIHESQRGLSEVKEKLRVSRGKAKEMSPNHITHWMSVEQIDKDFGRTLARIRPN